MHLLHVIFQVTFLFIGHSFIPFQLSSYKRNVAISMSEEPPSTHPGMSNSFPVAPKLSLPIDLNRIVPIASFLTISQLLSAISVKATDEQLSNYPIYQLPRPFAYSVEYTSPPSLIPRSTRGEESLIKRLANSDIIILGGHTGNTIEAITDAALELNLLTRIRNYATGSSIISTKNPSRGSSNSRVLAIGLPLPAIQSVKDALNTYIRTVSEVELNTADAMLQESIRSLLGTDNNNAFDISTNLPILHFAREKGIELVPLDIEPGSLNTVFGSGLAGLPDETRLSLVPDLEGFVQSVAGDGFKRYTDNVLANGYEKTQAVQATSKASPTLSVENYISGRILRDEVMAVQAAKWISEQSRPSVLVALLDEGQTKFGFGVQERLTRNLARLRATATTSETSSSKSTSSDTGEILSVLLNPTAADTLSMTTQLRLCLAYGQFLKAQRPLANFLWFSNYPPLKLLARTKNPINAEGEKPPGESSILKAF